MQSDYRSVDRPNAFINAEFYVISVSFERFAFAREFKVISLVKIFKKDFRAAVRKTGACFYKNTRRR